MVNAAIDLFVLFVLYLCFLTFCFSLLCMQSEVLLSTLKMRAMSTWMQSDVADWIESIGYAQYRDHFVRNNISGTALAKLTIDSLKTDIRTLRNKTAFFLFLFDNTFRNWQTEERFVFSRVTSQKTKNKTKQSPPTPKNQEIGSFGHRSDIAGKIAAFSVMPIVKPVQVVEQDFGTL